MLFSLNTEYLVLQGTKPRRVAAILEMAAILDFLSGTISNTVQCINIYQYVTFNTVWPHISVIIIIICWMARSLVLWRPSLNWQPYWIFVFSWHYMKYCSWYQKLPVHKIWCCLVWLFLWYLTWTKQGHVGNPVAAIFEMAAILDLFFNVYYVQNCSVFQYLPICYILCCLTWYLWDIIVECHEAPSRGGHL
jgi:hypothetical protein